MTSNGVVVARSSRVGGVPAAAAGALTGVSALAVGELVAALWPGARSPVTGLGRALIDATPGPAIDVGVALVGERDKPLLAAALAGGFEVAGATGGYWPRHVLALRR